MTGIIVTGGASGIGEAIVFAAAQRGYAVAVLDQNPRTERLLESAARAGAPKAVAIKCDVANEGEVAEAFRSAFSSIGPVSGVVANAGIERSAPLHDMDFGTWKQVINTNLTGAYLTVKYALRLFLEQETRGSIVCTSSPSAFVGFAGGGNGAYGASKGGVTSLVKSAAIDYAAYGIRVNALVPGATDTALLRLQLTTDADEQLEAAARLQIPLGRLAQPGEVAAAALWLLGDESSYVTGTSLVCDGGLMAKSANTI